MGQFRKFVKVHSGLMQQDVLIWEKVNLSNPLLFLNSHSCYTYKNKFFAHGGLGAEPNFYLEIDPGLASENYV